MKTGSPQEFFAPRSALARMRRGMLATSAQPKGVRQASSSALTSARKLMSWRTTSYSLAACNGVEPLSSASFTFSSSAGRSNRAERLPIMNRAVCLELFTLSKAMCCLRISPITVRHTSAEFACAAQCRAVLPCSSTASKSALRRSNNETASSLPVCACLSKGVWPTAFLDSMSMSVAYSCSWSSKRCRRRCGDCMVWSTVSPMSSTAWRDARFARSSFITSTEPAKWMGSRPAASDRQVARSFAVLLSNSSINDTWLTTPLWAAR
mmetsp:Transcript_7571/g.22371  ORF Transcript_7571/g.22371 Transcript_7571/m.22371 type:complete len:266 (-) Transcript_7571:397-1194(-)